MQYVFPRENACTRGLSFRTRWASHRHDVVLRRNSGRGNSSWLCRSGISTLRRKTFISRRVRENKTRDAAACKFWKSRSLSRHKSMFPHLRATYKFRNQNSNTVHFSFPLVVIHSVKNRILAPETSQDKLLCIISSYCIISRIIQKNNIIITSRICYLL